MAGVLFFLVTGAIFVWFGLTTNREMPLVTVLGACFMVYGVYQAVLARRLSGQGRDDRGSDRRNAVDAG